jgi:hypothetical protein
MCAKHHSAVITKGSIPWRKFELGPALLIALSSNLSAIVEVADNVGMKATDTVDPEQTSAAFQMAKAAIPRTLFTEVLRLIDGLRLPPDPTPA